MGIANFCVPHVATIEREKCIVEMSCDMDNRMTRRQMEELQEDLYKKKTEYEHKNRVIISEERKQVLHGYK